MYDMDMGFADEAADEMWAAIADQADRASREDTLVTSDPIGDDGDVVAFYGNQNGVA